MFILTILTYLNELEEKKKEKKTFFRQWKLREICNNNKI